MNKLKALRLKVGKWMLDKSSRANNPQSLKHPKSFLFLRQDGKNWRLYREFFCFSGDKEI